MQKLLKNKLLWSILILVVLTALLIHYIANNLNDFLSLRLEQPFLLILLAIGSVATLYSNGAVMDVVLRPLGLHLRKMETFGLASVTRIGNQLAPGKLGLAIRASYLKRKYSFPLSKFASALGAAHILMYLFSSLLGLGALLMLARSDAGVETATFVLLLGGMCLFLLGLLLFSPQIKEGSNFFTRHLSRVINGWFFIRRDGHILWLASGWALAHVLSMALVIFASFNALGGDIGVLQALFITSLAILAGLIGITPAGLGINEGLIVVAANVLGIPVSVALAAALLRRVIAFTVLVIITPFITRYLFDAPLLETLRRTRSQPDQNSS
jgi:uncharacterized membrane protein YbhN (UPF0104 family)